MPETKLRVLPRGTARVPDYEAAANVRRYHGWKHDPTMGHAIHEYDATGQVRDSGRKTGGFVRGEAVVELPVTGEYIRHVRAGDLWPADAETAQLCGVKFDPKFGGEHALAAPDTAPSAEEH